MNVTRILYKSRLIAVNDYKIEEDKTSSAYYATFILVNYGFVVANPEYLTKEAFATLCDILCLSVPESFYENPQDTKHFTCEELLVEQIASYWFGYGTEDKRYELFEKALPNYPLSTEMKKRVYRIISQEEAKTFLHDYALDLCHYKRPFSSTEEAEMHCLFEQKYIEKDELVREMVCKDNIFLFLESCPELGRKLDLKDIVKLSFFLFGEEEKFIEKATRPRYQKEREILTDAYNRSKWCPLTKRQAKCVTKIAELVGEKKVYRSNSPQYYAGLEMKENNDLLAAARIYDESGSLLLRNIRYLLSRASEDEATMLLDMIRPENPAVLFQIYSTLDNDLLHKPRTFRFINENSYRSHTESSKEAGRRKSVLSDEMKKRLSDRLYSLLEEYYENRPKIGKIYLSEDFKKVALPLNTAASGDGIDVLPAGSRIKFDGDYLRTFCYWHKAMDIDASLVCLRESEARLGQIVAFNNQTLSWRTYSRMPLGKAALCSGDDTSRDGAEYQDIDIAMLGKKYRYAISCVNGYGSEFNIGTIKAGVQIKNEINTAAWDPKNIAFEIDVRGDCRSFTNFAVDLKTKEIIIINAKSNYSCVVNKEMVLFNLHYLSDKFLSFSMYDALKHRGLLVDDPKDALYVFDSEYAKEEGSRQIVVRPYDVATLMAFANGSR